MGCCNRGCKLFWLWFLQILCWAGLVLVIIMHKQFEYYIIFGVIYLIYIIVMLCSSTLTYLCHNRNGNDIYFRFIDLFKAAPRIVLCCTSYHWNGQAYTNTSSYKQESYKDKMALQYYSFRDISDPIELDLDSKEIEKYNFIKFNFDCSIEFADGITYSDYLRSKEYLEKKNYGKDECREMSEIRDIPSIKRHELISLKDKNPCFVGPCYYIIFTFLTFAQLYKIFLNCYCIEKNFTLKKTVSTRFNLLDPKFEEKYKNSNPSIRLGKINYTFKTNEVGCVYNEVPVVKPSQEEINNCFEYEKYTSKLRTNDKSLINVGINENSRLFYNDSNNTPPAIIRNLPNNMELISNENYPDINQNTNYQPPSLIPKTQGYNTIQYIPYS